MTQTALIDALHATRYAQLRTYRSDGSAVDTPIWFHLDGETLVFRTKRGPKTRRISADPRVELWPCDFSGRYAQGAPTVRGVASILNGASAAAANHALRRRYGWQYNLMPLLKLPGVKNVHQGLPLREKFRRLTSDDVWPDSDLVAVRLDVTEPTSTTPGPISTKDDPPRRS